MIELDRELIGVRWGTWHEEPCHNCGDVGLATRTHGCKAYVYLCGDCETWELAEKQFAGEITALKHEIGGLRTENKMLLETGVRSSRDRYLDMIGL